MMNHLGMALAIGCASISMAQAKAVPQPANADARQEILGLEQAWADAENRHDVTTLRSIIDDNFLFSDGADGKLYNKKTFIAANVRGDPDRQDPRRSPIALSSSTATPLYQWAQTQNVGQRWESLSSRSRAIR